MKKIITTICFTALIIGCSPKYERADLSNWYSNNLESLEAEISARGEYVADNRDHWQSPGITDRTLQGDCEDYALLMMDLADQMGHEFNYLVIVELGKRQHAIVCIDGKYYDPCNNRMDIYSKDFTIREELDFNQAMRRIDD
jgi:hypothetical protein